MPTRIPSLEQVAPARFEHALSRTWLEINGGACRQLNIGINGSQPHIVRDTTVVLYATVPTNQGRFLHAHRIALRLQLLTGEIPDGLEELISVPALSPLGSASILTDVDLKDTLSDMIDYADQSAMIPYRACNL